jgi:hypothetical protein
MKKFMIAAAVAVATLSPSVFAADVGVSVSIGQPGFYGRIDIGDYPYPQPVLVYREPRVIERVYVERDPVYMRVPPGHAKNWGRYCHQYNACGERVYFVQDSWYQHEYVPHYQERHRDYHDDYRDDRGYDDRDDNHGNQGNKHSNKNHGNGHKK